MKCEFIITSLNAEATLVNSKHSCSLVDLIPDKGTVRISKQNKYRDNEGKCAIQLFYSWQLQVLWVWQEHASIRINFGVVYSFLDDFHNKLGVKEIIIEGTAFMKHWILDNKPIKITISVLNMRFWMKLKAGIAI